MTKDHTVSQDPSGLGKEGLSSSVARSDARDAKSKLLRERGPVEALCREIGFPWDRRLERQDVFVGFVRELVGEVAAMRDIAEHTAKFTGKAPSDGSAEVLALCEAMLSAPGEASAAEAHEACWRLNPDEAYPTDHLIDMLSSCASAIRFGLGDKFGITSRHAAAAAQHIWKRKYDVSLFDGCTGAWENDWARQVFTRALIGLLPRQEDPSPLSAQLGATATDQGREEPQ